MLTPTCDQPSSSEEKRAEMIINVCHGDIDNRDWEGVSIVRYRLDDPDA